MLTRRLSQRVLTLSLPKVNRRKRRQMRYFCVLTRRCASRPSSERKNWPRRNSRRVALQPQKRRLDDRVAGRPVRGWRRPTAQEKPRTDAARRPRGLVGRRIAQLSFAPSREGAFRPLGDRAAAALANLSPQQANTWRCLSV